MNVSIKTPGDSSVESRYVILPQHANHYGTAFGGVIMSWIDLVAVMVAQRHCGREAVTASIDRIAFITPIHIGDHVILKACVNYVGTTSMEIGVQVTKENPYTGEQTRATTAYLTFVALDQHKIPTKIPELRLTSDNETRRYNNAKLRVQLRRDMLQKLSQPEGRQR